MQLLDDSFLRDQINSAGFYDGLAVLFGGIERICITAVREWAILPADLVAFARKVGDERWEFRSNKDGHQLNPGR
jgi:hypothetical protein